MVYSFYFLLVGSRRNECNSLWEELRGRGQKSTATQKVCLTAFLLALTLYLQWSILFIFCVLVPHGMNSIVLGGIKGGEIRSLLLARKVVAYSDTVSAMLIFSSFTDDKMILQAIAVHDTFIIILSQYIVFINACHTLHDAHLVAR